MSSMAPLRTETIYQAAQERIKQYILDHALGPGEPIPTETVLARELGISRNTLREALKALNTAGVVETRHGLGTYVGNTSLAPLIDGMAFNLALSIARDTRTLREMLHVREILEVELILRAIGTHTPEQLAHLKSLVARMEADAAREVMDSDVDRAFHDALYEPLDNNVVALILHAFWDVQNAVETQLPARPPMAAENARWHRNILDAVRRGDAPAAMAAMREQFTGARQRLALERD
jgi:DNA-binding FadR family transcriptional regulator